MLTQKEANAADSFSTLQSYGITEADYLEMRDDRAREYGGEPAPGDVVWALWQRVVQEVTHDPMRAAQVYRDMALTIEREGRDATHLYRAATKSELEGHKQSGYDIRVAVLTARDERTCEACIEAEKRGEVTIDEALENPLVPNPACTSERCRCTYLETMADDPTPAASADSSSGAQPAKSGCLGVLLLPFIAGLLGAGLL